MLILYFSCNDTKLIFLLVSEDSGVKNGSSRVKDGSLRVENGSLRVDEGVDDGSEAETHFLILERGGWGVWDIISEGDKIGRFKTKRKIEMKNK